MTDIIISSLGEEKKSNSCCGFFSHTLLCDKYL